MSSPALKVTVHVTQEDIDAGVKCCCFSCPIARAVEREFFDSSIVVNFNTVKARARGWAGATLSAHLSPEAVAFTKNFDEGKQVSPITLNLEFYESAR